MEKHTVILFFLILFSSCTKIVDIHFPEHTPELVVNCLFTPDSLLTLQVSTTVGFNDSIKNEFTESLDIELYCDDNYIEDLTDQGKGTYISNIYPEVEKMYKIKINRENAKTITAQSYIPKLPEYINFDTILSFYYDPKEENFFSLGLLSINDSPTSDDYYSFQLTMSSRDFNNFYYIGYKYTDERLKSSEIEKYEKSFMLFTDKYFNGQDVVLSFDYTAWSTDSQTYYLIYKFKTLSSDYYKYINSLIIHTENQDYFNDPFYVGQPVKVYSNIKNGYGIFAGFNSYTDSLLIQNWLY